MPSARKRIQWRPCQEEFAKVQTIPKEDRGSFSMQASVRFWNVQLQQKSQQDQYFFWSQLATSGSGPTDTFLAANQRILPLSSTNLGGKACQSFGTVSFLLSTFVSLACKKLTMTWIPFQSWKNGGALQCSTFFCQPRCEDFELLLRMLPHRAVHLRTSPHRHKWCLGRAVPVWHHELQNVTPKKKRNSRCKMYQSYGWHQKWWMSTHKFLDVWTEKTCSLVSVETSLCMSFVYSWHRMDTENNQWTRR